jgi:hypothetical protein
MDPQLQTKLARLLGLLGGDHDGEKLAAVSAIKRLLTSRGLTFADLVNTVGKSRVVVRQAEPDPIKEIINTAQAILVNKSMMRENEIKFVKQILMQARISHDGNFHMTEKQSRWFAFLYAKYGELDDTAGDDTEYDDD